LYDLQIPHANGKGPHQTHQHRVRNATSRGLTVQTQPATNVNNVIEDDNLQTLASLRMCPEISPEANPVDTATTFTTDVESSSDDGIDYVIGDTYLLMDESDLSRDNNYDSTYMEEDGNYEDFLGCITYNYGDLNEQLSAPVNMYNGRGPILR